FFSSRRRHTRSKRDWSSDVCSSDLMKKEGLLWKRTTGSLMNWIISMSRKAVHINRPSYLLPNRSYVNRINGSGKWKARWTGPCGARKDGMNNCLAISCQRRMDDGGYTLIDLKMM